MRQTVFQLSSSGSPHPRHPLGFEGAEQAWIALFLFFMYRKCKSLKLLLPISEVSEYWLIRGFTPTRVGGSWFYHSRGKSGQFGSSGYWVGTQCWLKISGSTPYACVYPGLHQCVCYCHVDKPLHAREMDVNSAHLSYWCTCKHPLSVLLLGFALFPQAVGHIWWKSLVHIRILLLWIPALRHNNTEDGLHLKKL